MQLTRFIALVELGIAALLTCAAASAAWNLFFAPADPQHRYGELLGIALISVPLAGSFWICGAALLGSWRQRWRLHVLPAVVLVALCSAPWWLKYVV